MSFLGRLSELVANSLRRGVCVLNPAHHVYAVVDIDGDCSRDQARVRRQEKLD
jgi:hypothetical protein